MSISVILAAAGKGSRLYTETVDFCKPLFVYQSKPIIAHLIDYYKKFSNDIIIVHNSNEMGLLLKNWLIDYYGDKLNFIEQPEFSGTNDAINRALPIIKNDKLLISWADFIVQNDFSKELGEENIFFTADITCRFTLQGNKITNKKDKNGFCGIYYLNGKPELDLSKEDFIENYIDKEVKTKQVDLITLGTITELIENKAFEKTSNRFFNKIKFTEKSVFKYAIDKQGIDLQKKEVNWYNNLPDDMMEYTANYAYVQNENLLMLDRIYGKPISECKLDSNFWKVKLPSLFNALHQGKYPVNEKDCIETYVNKPKQRVDKVKNIINSWFSKNKIINNIDFSDWQFPEVPTDLIPEYFTFVHGDLQFSNSMLDLDGNIKIIDPRGYFGETSLYGDPAYDIAKILYAVSGYDKINENKFGLFKSLNGNTNLIHSNTVEMNGDVIWFFKWACEKYKISTEKLNFLLFSIWLSLTSYIINEPQAIIASYCKALLLSKKIYETKSLVKNKG